MGEFIGGMQEIRVNPTYAQDNPNNYTVTIPKNGTYTVDQYALIYFGKDQPKKQEVIFNDTLMNKPYLKIGYEEKNGEVYIYAKDIYHNTTDAEVHYQQNFTDYVLGLGIVKRWTDEYNYYYAIGVHRVKYWDGDDFKPINAGEFNYKLVGSNSVEIKNTTGHSISVNYGYWTFLSPVTGVEI
jgi:hypothetical protein